MRPDDELKRNRRRVFVIGAAILFAMALAGKISWIGGTIDIGSHRHARGPLAIEAEQIYDAYRDDAHAADKRFRGREMVVSGEFLRIVPDGQGNPDLRFKTSNSEAPLGVDLIPMSYDEAGHLRPGQRLTVSCQRITGSGDDRWLQNCAIQTAATSSAPSPPSPPPAPSPGEGNKG
jgi:hypothetical protein